MPGGADFLHLGILQYDFTLLGRLALAAMLGGMLGFEREIHGRPAGFRTHLLVTVGACLMMGVAEFYYQKYARLNPVGPIRIDPGRVAAQIVTGIGFLGAGAIIKDGSAVRGLTTAACLWVAAGIGMAVGIGLYVPALATTAMTVGFLMFLKHAEKRLAKDRYANLTVFYESDPAARSRLETYFADKSLRLAETAVEKDTASGVIRCDFVIARFGRLVPGKLVDEISALPGVRKVRIR